VVAALEVALLLRSIRRTHQEPLPVEALISSPTPP
jgi:hypothetical protein